MLSRYFSSYRVGSWHSGALLLAGLLSTIGCGGTQQVEVAGAPEDAGKMLAVALDAWRDGKKADELMSGKPRIMAQDEDWAAGAALKSYSEPAAPLKYGGHWRVATTLTLAPAGKPEVKKPVAYAVTLGSPVSIIRVDDRESMN